MSTLVGNIVLIGIGITFCVVGTSSVLGVVGIACFGAGAGASASAGASVMNDGWPANMGVDVGVTGCTVGAFCTVGEVGITGWR